MQGGQRPVDHGTELGVRQERPVQRQVLGVDHVVGGLGGGPSGPLHDGTGLFELVAVPDPAYGHGLSGVRTVTPGVEAELDGDLGCGVLVEVAPALLPYLSTPLPAEVVARQGHLGGLGEARLAGAVAADHQCQNGAGAQVDRGGGPDATPARGGDGPHVHSPRTAAAAGLGGGQQTAQQVLFPGGEPRPVRPVRSRSRRVVSLMFDSLALWTAAAGVPGSTRGDGEPLSARAWRTC